MKKRSEERVCELWGREWGRECHGGSERLSPRGRGRESEARRGRRGKKRKVGGKEN